MPESFFAQFFDPKKPRPGASAPGAQPPSPPASTITKKDSPRQEEGPQAPEAAARAGGAEPAAGLEKFKSDLSARLNELERELSKERERALTYEIKFKEMQNAQSAVEEMFEKMWAKASKERADEEMRLIREKSLSRVETVEKRLDEFQKGVLDLLKDLSTRSGRDDSATRAAFERRFDELRQTMFPSLEAAFRRRLDQEWEAFRQREQALLAEMREKNESQWQQVKDRGEQVLAQALHEIHSQRERLAEMARSAASRAIAANEERHEGRHQVILDQLRAEKAGLEEKLAALNARVDGFQKAQQDLYRRLMGLDQFCNSLIFDFREMQAGLGAVKGSLPVLVEQAGQKLIQDVAEKLNLELARWRDELKVNSERVWDSQSKFKAQVIEPWEKEMAARLRQMLTTAREEVVKDMESMPQWNQWRQMGANMERLFGELEGMQQGLAALKLSWNKEMGSLAGKLEQSRTEAKTALVNTHHLEETIRLLLQLVENFRHNRPEK